MIYFHKTHIKFHFAILLTLSLTLFLIACRVGQTQEERINTELKNQIESTVAPINRILKYPFLATKERCAHIMQQSRLLREGMDNKEVLSLMGEPEQIFYTYKYIKPENQKPVGFQYRYICSQDSKSGSVVDKNIKGIALSFNGECKLKRIDFLGNHENN